MPHKNQRSHSNAKKSSPAPDAQIDNELVQHMLEQYPQIAQALHESKHASEVEAALGSIYDMPEATQIAFLKALGKAATVGAADILLAVYTSDAAKEVHKQARRSLIHLEQARIYPQWEPPKEPGPLEAFLDTFADPPRFWKGMFTDTEDTGEIQLVLCWEQGENYQEVRMLFFLLDFWHDGVKDFFEYTGSKESVEKRIDEMKAQLSGVKLINCTLPEGRHFLEEAFATNKRFNTPVSQSYTHNFLTIQQLVYEIPEDNEDLVDDDLFDEDDGPISSDLGSLPDLLQSLLSTVSNTEDAAAGFMQHWAEKDYDAAYDLLTDDSPLREGLARDEWVARREQWSNQARLDNAKPVFIADRKSETANGRILVDIGWSATMVDTPLEGAPKEMPAATAIFRENGRRWFWICCTLVNTNNTLRVYDISDESASLLQVPVQELQQYITESIEQGNAKREEAARKQQEVLEELEGDEEEDEEDIDEEIDVFNKDLLSLIEGMTGTMNEAAKAAYYCDALIAKSKATITTFQQAKQLATWAEDDERAAMFMQAMAERFPEERAQALQDLSFALAAISGTYDEKDDEEQANYFRTRAEQTLRDCVALGPKDTTPYTTLAHILCEEDKFDEAETLLLQAQALAQTPDNQARIEHDLGLVAENRDDLESALNHFQHAIALQPDYAHVWYHIGTMQHRLGQIEEGERSLLRCIEGNDTEVDAYSELALIYVNQGKFETAKEILADGLDANPDAAELAASLSLVYLRLNDLQFAHRYLQKAESIEPELEIVQAARVQYNAFKKLQQAHKPKPKSKPHKAKKKR